MVSNSVLLLFLGMGVSGQPLMWSRFLSLSSLSPCGAWLFRTNLYAFFSLAWDYFLFGKRRFSWEILGVPMSLHFQILLWFTQISEHWAERWGCVTEEHRARGSIGVSPLLSLDHNKYFLLVASGVAPHRSRWAGMCAGMMRSTQQTSFNPLNPYEINTLSILLWRWRNWGTEGAWCHLHKVNPMS